MDADGQLRVHVVGGGPAGLVTAINAAEWSIKYFGHAKARKLFHFQVSDVRYQVTDDGTVIYGGARSAPGARRSQVVTLQDNCLESLSRDTRALLLRDVDEKVWSQISRSIPIREVEDRLVERAQDPVFHGLLALKALGRPPNDGDVDGEAAAAFQRSVCDSFNVVVGADGSGSWVRRRLLGVPEADLGSVGAELALGIAFQVPRGRFEHGLPLPQTDNVVRTVMQRRYLMSASSFTRSGTLSIQVSPEEFEQARRCDGKECVFGRSPGRLFGDAVRFRPQRDSRSAWLPALVGRLCSAWPDCVQKTVLHRASGAAASTRLWQTVLDGLRLFGIEESHVTGVVGYKLDVRSSPVVVSERDGRVVALVGDAAFQTHLWPGRGVNCAVKEAAFLAYAIFSCKASVADPSLADRTVCHDMLEFAEYAAFVQRLRESEHGSRSMRHACPRTGEKAAVDPVDRMKEVVRQASRRGRRPEGALVDRARSWARTLKGRLQIGDAGVQRVVERLQDDLPRLGDLELRVMDLSADWPNTGGVQEVLPLPGLSSLAAARRRDAPPAGPPPPPAQGVEPRAERPLKRIDSNSAEGAMMALTNLLAHSGDAEAKRVAAEARGLAADGKAAEAQVMVAGAVANLAYNGGKDLARRLAAAPGALEAIGRLAAKGKSEAAQGWAASALGISAYVGGAKTCRRIAALPGVPEALSRLVADGSAEDARANAAWALGTLASGGSSICRQFAALPGLPEALARLVAEGASEDSKGKAAGALRSIAADGGPETASRIAGLPGLPEALAGLAAEGHGEDVRGRAALALGSLASGGGLKICRRIAELPGLSKALAQLVADGCDADAQGRAATALRNLATYGGPEIASQVAELPGLAEALQRLASEGKSPSAKEGAEKALKALF